MDSNYWLRVLRRSPWAPVWAQLGFAVFVFGLLWQFVEPASSTYRCILTRPFENTFLALITLALLGGLQLTVIFMIVVRVTDRPVQQVTRTELLQVNHELHPVLPLIATLRSGPVSPELVQNLMQSIASAVARIHFGLEELPPLSAKGEPHLPCGVEYSCGLCGRYPAPTTRIGQCKQCKLFSPGWSGVFRQPSDSRNEKSDTDDARPG